MGLSSLPAPSEGMLCIILVNTALTISIFKNFIQTILHIFRFQPSSSSSLSSPPTPASTTESPLTHPLDFSDFSPSPTETYIEKFRNQIPTVRFDAVSSLIKGDHDCSVCLTKFTPQSQVNHLSCRHVFHNTCLERWLDYYNITCPLCRKPLMQEEDSPCFW